VYSGAFGLIATDVNDNLDLYSGSGTTWTNIGGPGAMFAVGTSSVLGLSANADSVHRYDGTRWVQIGDAATSVYAGNLLMATDLSGSPAVYTVSTDSWALIGGPGDQFLVNGSGIASIAPDHQSVHFNSSGTAGGWTQIGNSTSELFAGPDSGLAGTALAATRDIYYYASTLHWVRQGDPGAMFALAGSGTLYGLTPTENAVYKSNNTTITNPSWTKVGGPGSRLFGHGTRLYAAGAIVY